MLGGSQYYLQLELNILISLYCEYYIELIWT